MLWAAGGKGAGSAAFGPALPEVLFVIFGEPDITLLDTEDDSRGSCSCPAWRSC